MYKVFVNNKPLYLLTTQEFDETKPHNKQIIPYKDENNVFKAVNRLNDEAGLDSLIIVGNDKKILEQMKRMFNYLKAAGGLVHNQEHKILLIFRNGYWDLPKGKLEKNESKKQGALREVTEECGLNSCEIKGKLPSTFHLYKLKNEWVLKKTFWYEMFSTQTELVPQTEEGIESIEWYDKNQVQDKTCQNMFVSIKELLEFYLTKY